MEQPSSVAPPAPLTIRLAIALLVLLTTFLGWAAWGAGRAGAGLAQVGAAIMGKPAPHFADGFGTVWQWPMAAAAGLLLVALFKVPRRAALFGAAWVLAIAVMLVSTVVTYGPFDPQWTLLVPLAGGLGLVLWIRKLGLVQPNQRLEPTRR